MPGGFRQNGGFEPQLPSYFSPGMPLRSPMAVQPAYSGMVPPTQGPVQGNNIENDVVNGIDGLLEALAKNKAQQMCKSTIHLCVEFILAVFTLVTTIQNEAANELHGESSSSSDGYYGSDGGRRIGGAGKGNVPTQVYWASGLAALYVFILIVGMLSSMFKTQKYSTIKEVEDAFSQANKFPFVEAIYGLFLCKNYANPGSKAFPRACILWIIYAVMLIILLYLITHLATSSTTALTSLQIALQLFRISSDITEYLARTNLDERSLRQHGRQAAAYAHAGMVVDRALNRGFKDFSAPQS